MTEKSKSLTILQWKDDIKYNICKAACFVSSQGHTLCVCVCVFRALVLCHLVFACCHLVLVSLLFVLGVSPALLRNKTSMHACSNHSTDCQDVVCVHACVCLCVAVACAPVSTHLQLGMCTLKCLGLGVFGL